MIYFANSCVFLELNCCEFVSSHYVSATSTDRTVYFYPCLISDTVLICYRLPRSVLKWFACFRGTLQVIAIHFCLESPVDRGATWRDLLLAAPNKTKLYQIRLLKPDPPYCRMQAENLRKSVSFSFHVGLARTAHTVTGVASWTNFGSRTR